MTQARHNPAGESTVTRNVIWNLAGEGLPLAAALLAVPMLIWFVGTERFGVITIVWAMIGYFGMFDLGLGRTLTKFLADALAGDRSNQAPNIFWTGNAMLLCLGLFGGAAVALLAPWLTHRALRMSGALRSESLNSLYVLALSVPVVVVSAGFRGTLAALGRFDVINSVRIPMNAGLMLGPLCVVPFSSNLVWIVTVMALVRLGGCGVQAAYCFHLMPNLRIPRRPSRKLLPALLSFTGWVATSNLVSALFTNADRFLIGAMLSMTAVAWYSTPHDMLLRLQIIPSALEGVLFPAFAQSFARDDHRALTLLQRAVKLIVFASFPILFCLHCRRSRHGRDVFSSAQCGGARAGTIINASSL